MVWNFEQPNPAFGTPLGWGVTCSCSIFTIFLIPGASSLAWSRLIASWRDSMEMRRLN